MRDQPALDDPLDAYSRRVAEIVERVAPAVVRVEGQAGRRPAGAGSGVIIADDGLLLTNSHVVRGFKRVRMVLAEGGGEAEGDVLGDDPDTDLALLRAELPRGVPVARLAIRRRSSAAISSSRSATRSDSSRPSPRESFRPSAARFGQPPAG